MPIASKHKILLKNFLLECSIMIDNEYKYSCKTTLNAHNYYHTIMVTVILQATIILNNYTQLALSISDNFVSFFSIVFCADIFLLSYILVPAASSIIDNIYIDSIKSRLLTI